VPSIPRGWQTVSQPAAARRAFVKPSLLAQPAADKLRDNLENRLGYWLPLTLLVLVPITGLMLEGARINAAHPNFTEWAYIGRNVGKLEGALGAGATFHRWLWLFHVTLVYGLLFCLPLTKLRHFLIAPINLYFRNLKPRGRLAPIFPCDHFVSDDRRFMLYVGAACKTTLLDPERIVLLGLRATGPETQYDWIACAPGIAPSAARCPTRGCPAPYGAAL
jgi:hypothetical protein